MLPALRGWLEAVLNLLLKCQKELPAQAVPESEMAREFQVHLKDLISNISNSHHYLFAVVGAECFNEMKILLIELKYPSHNKYDDKPKRKKIRIVRG